MQKVQKVFMKLSRNSVRKTDLYAHHYFYILSLSLSFPFSIHQLTMGVSLFQLNLFCFATTSVAQSSCCCQSLKLLLSVVISVKSMQPSSTPFTSSPHHIQHTGVLPLCSSEALLYIASIQIFSHFSSPPSPPPTVPRHYRQDIP